MKDDQLPKRLQQWLENNKDAVGILAKKIREVDTVKGIKSEEERLGRELAIKIVESWISEVYGIAWQSDFFYEEEDDGIVKYLDKPVN